MIIHIYIIFLISYLSSYLSLRFMLWYSSFSKCCVHTKLAICNTYINSVSVFILTQDLAPLRFIQFLLLIIIFVSYNFKTILLYYYITIYYYYCITITILLYIIIQTILLTTWYFGHTGWSRFQTEISAAAISRCEQYNLWCTFRRLWSLIFHNLT